MQARFLVEADFSVGLISWTKSFALSKSFAWVVRKGVIKLASSSPFLLPWKFPSPRCQWIVQILLWPAYLPCCTDVTRSSHVNVFPRVRRNVLHLPDQNPSIFLFISFFFSWSQGLLLFKSTPVCLKWVWNMQEKIRNKSGSCSSMTWKKMLQREKIKQVLSTIHTLCLTWKTKSCTSYFQLKKPQPIKFKKKIHAPENCPTNTQWYISNRMIDEITKSDDGTFIDNGENVIIRNVQIF